MLAASLHDWLVALGHEAFLDRDLHDGIAVGEQWEQRLYERLRWADAVVCVVTTAYLASVWCTAEVTTALSQGSRLLPLLAEPGVEHPLLKSRQHADYARDPDVARSRLGEALRRIDEIGGWAWPEGRSPFPGLKPFDSDLHRAFFGRRAEVEELAGLLRSPAARADGLVLVVGPSGCGKSSLVRAGLLPVMADEADWLTLAPFFPGDEPLAALAVELAAAGRQAGMVWMPTQVRERLAGGRGLAELAEELLLPAPGRRRRRRLLLVVDQLEELLTQATPEARAEFARVLRPVSDGLVQVVATIRPESLQELLRSPELADLPVRPFPLRPLRREALPAVVRGPARLAGIGVEDELVDRLVADTGTGEALPLLAFTLAELAEGVGRGGHLPMAGYEALDGVHGALTRQADAALVAACEAAGRGRDDVIAGLLRLVTVDERGDPTRWRVRCDELPEPVRAELDEFVARRLLTTGTDEGGNELIVVAHEAFLSAWPPLAEAIRADVSALRARRAVEQATSEWEENDRSRRRLWEGNQLAGAVAATGARLPLGRRTPVTDGVDLSPRAREFLRRSIRVDRGRRQRLAAILSLLLAAALVAAVAAVAQARDATSQQRIATSLALVAEADVLRDTQPRVSLLLSVEALRLDPSSAAREGLLATLTQSHLAGALRVHTGSVHAVAFGDDGRILATGGADGTAVLWDTTDRAQPARLAPLGGRPGGVLAVAFTRDGRTLASGGAGGADLWDVTDPARPAHLASLGDGGGVIFGVAFSPDGRTLATAGDDGTARLWDLTDRAHPVPLTTLGGHARTVFTVAFGPDGRTLASGGDDGMATLWDVANRVHPDLLATLAGHAGTVFAVAFSPDGSTLATGSGDGTAALWDLTDPAHPTRLATLSGHTSYVYAVAFSPDGNVLASGSYDGTAIVWDLADRAHPARKATLSGHTTYVLAVAFSPDGRTLAAGGGDGTAILWDLADRTRPPSLATIRGHPGAVFAIAFSPDGRTLATASGDSTTTLWDLADRLDPARLASFPGRGGPILALAFSPDGRTLATGGADGTALLWNLVDRANPAPLATVNGQGGPVDKMSFSADGRTLATGAGAGTAILWDVTDRAHPVRAANLSDEAGDVDALAFSPRRRTLATGGGDGTATLWDTARGAHPARLADLRGHAGSVGAVAFSMDGRTLATGSGDRTGMLWDLQAAGHPAQVVTGHTGSVDAVAFSSDGDTLATGSGDRTAIMWDLTDRDHPARLATLTGHTAGVDAVAFSRDGQILVTASRDGTAILWDVGATTEVARHAVALACAVAGPALSPGDWARYVPGMPYQRTCP